MANKIGVQIMTASSALALAALMQGCSSLPERVDTLEQARALVQKLEQDPLTQDVAQTRFESAQQALARADEAYEEKESLEVIEQDAYLALRNAQIAEQQLAKQRARDELQDGEAERAQVLLQAREREAESARQLAEQRSSQLSRQSQQLEQQAEQTEQARERTQQLEQQTQQLQEELSDLKTEQTERGLVLTFDDVLFDTDGATLNPGAASTMQRVADFLMDHPERHILIEGHTDGTGSFEYNMELSQRRADAVRQALVDHGISPDRVRIQGLGEAYPVATNDTSAGRQLNRRVEVVVSDQQGEFPRNAQRTATAGGRGAG